MLAAVSSPGYWAMCWSRIFFNDWRLLTKLLISVLLSEFAICYCEDNKEKRVSKLLWKQKFCNPQCCVGVTPTMHIYVATAQFNFVRPRYKSGRFLQKVSRFESKVYMSAARNAPINTQDTLNWASWSGSRSCSDNIIKALVCFGVIASLSIHRRRLLVIGTD